MVFGHGDLINNIRLCWNCKTGIGEEVPGGTDPRSIPDYSPKGARQRSPVSSFIFREAALHSGSGQANMLEPDYCQVRLVEIGVGRRFWQSNPSAENAHAFYVRVVKPLRRLQHRGVVERLQAITATDDRTPIAVEIIGQVDLTKVSKQ